MYIIIVPKIESNEAKLAFLSDKLNLVVSTSLGICTNNGLLITHKTPNKVLEQSR